MLAWSDAGAVEAPTAVQIRVQRSYPGRIRAGAPVPTRSMSEEEIEANVRFFATDAPRRQRCTTIVLSGVGVASRPDLGSVLELARSLQMDRIVLHVGVEDMSRLSLAALQGKIDELSLLVEPGSLVAARGIIADANERAIPIVTNTVLSESAIADIEATARLLAGVKPPRATLTYPFPVNGSDATAAPPPLRAVAQLRIAVDVLERAGIAVAVKGLPACYLGPDARLLQRSHNRWYVDADHQREGALLFFPTVVAFHKDDVCRFCRLDDRCDGFFAAYLHRPGTPALQPIE